MEKNKKIKKQEKKLLKKQAKLGKKQAKLQKKWDELQSENKPKVTEKNKNLIRLANGVTMKNPVKPTPLKKSKDLDRNIHKKHKKAQKKFEKIRKIVKKSFPDLEQKGMDSMINSLANSVRLNKSFILNDKRNRKEWEERYINELFTEFKQLIENYNKAYAFKADDLQHKIGVYQGEIKKLTEEVNTLEKRKAELEKTIAE